MRTGDAIAEGASHPRRHGITQIKPFRGIAFTTLRAVWSPPAQRLSDRAGKVETDGTINCPARVSIPGPLLLESSALPTGLPGATELQKFEHTEPGVYLGERPRPEGGAAETAVAVHRECWEVIRAGHVDVHARRSHDDTDVPLNALRTGCWVEFSGLSCSLVGWLVN